MARSYKKKLSQVISDTKKLFQRKQLQNEMLYCKKCGWGWEAMEGGKCPHCGEEFKEC